MCTFNLKRPLYICDSVCKCIRGQREDVDLEDTGIEMADDSEIKPIHGGKSYGQGKSPQAFVHSLACRICMGIVATGIFVFMLIQLWQNYGDQIKTRVLSPVVVGAGKFDENGASGKSFDGVSQVGKLYAA